ncbi:MAG: TIR domain-containing protein [Crocinitomicaceae bacterium]|nr:TIR domain-containing protein [Crocinitomicaceae bacterium]MBK8925021.1 TIR domain-containing protein [Crocinitomicaceae bacterium]
MATKRKIFYSFHYQNDVFRVQQIRNIGALEENEPVSANNWEEVKKGGDKAIEKWINDNMQNRTCVVVLVGEETAARPWVRYEIKKAWNEGKGVLGIYIHNLKCAKKIKENPFSSGKCNKGTNPFDSFTVDGKNMSDYVSCHNPNSSDPYNDIKSNLEKWIENAIEIRNNYKS